MALWKQAAQRGRPPIYKTPQEIWEAACAYFKWAEENPLIESKIFCSEGVIRHGELKKVRPFTIGGMCLHMGISVDTWENYRKKPEFVGITKTCDEIVREQKFSGAAAGLLNPVIIARDLGLREVSDHVSSDGSMTPKGTVDFSKISDAALAELMAARSSG